VKHSPTGVLFIPCSVTEKLGLPSQWLATSWTAVVRFLTGQGLSLRHNVHTGCGALQASCQTGSLRRIFPRGKVVRAWSQPLTTSDGVKNVCGAIPPLPPPPWWLRRSHTAKCSFSCRSCSVSCLTTADKHLSYEENYSHQIHCAKWAVLEWMEIMVQWIKGGTM
jgi:hypothetical protein